MNELMNKRFPSWGVDLFNDEWPKSNWSPAVNVVDNPDDYQVELAAPGVKKDDFKVDVDDRLLTISCETKTESEEKEKNYTRREFSSKSFKRQFTVPNNVDLEDVSAKYEDGVLRLTLKKINKEEPKKREVLIS